MRLATIFPVCAVIIVVLAVVMGSCTDVGDPVVTEEQPVTANRTSVYLPPGFTANILVSGGRAPYGITDFPDSTVATARLADTTSHSVSLILTALTSVAIGRISHVSVGDADELMEGGGGALRLAHGENEVDIEIFITNAVSFANNVQPVFTAKCAIPTCHTGTAAPYGLVLDSTQSYVNLVNVTTSSPGCNGELLVSPGNATGSVLYKAISGISCGPRMPQSILPGDTLPSLEHASIRDWIDQGALNN